VLNEEVRVIGAGRTDTGVHALGQVASVLTSTRLRTEQVRLGLRAHLPDDIAVLEVSDADPSFHARHDALSRTYAYRVAFRDTALDRNRAWFPERPIDLARMERATRGIPGRHDFHSFSAAGGRERDPVLRVEEARWERDALGAVFTVTAERFLYRMVRRMLGALVAIGAGDLPEDFIGEALGRRDRRWTTRTAPPHGLYLVRVLYPGDPGTEGMPGHRRRRAAPDPGHGTKGGGA
jgi:tRNA pseudouridine38-40 synthase